ncbi:MAG: MSMEG_1061 family FMN-dependent PPOX-type flavoprotein [Actinomycetota bacterium]
MPWWVMFDPRHVVSTVDELRDRVPPPRPAQATKVLRRLDRHGRAWIERSPFVVISSTSNDGNIDVSPKGDPAGFVRILDDTTVAIPDRPGNRRMDTFQNVIETGVVGLMFLVPERGEVLRIRGSAQVVDDPDLLTTLTERGRDPVLALVVSIREVMFHCGKSVIRSGLWSPEAWPGVGGLASYAECLADQTTSDETVEEMETRFATWHAGNELY